MRDVDTMMRRRDLMQGSLVLLLAAPQLVHGAQLVAVRVWPADEYTRVTLESDTALAAEHQVLADPPRLVIDIAGLELSPELRELVGQVRPDDPFIDGVRIGRYRPRVVRLVVDLKQPVRPQQFTLAPVAAYNHRLVFDLYPTEARDPLLALVQGKIADDHRAGGAAARAAQSVRDALGEFIAGIDAGKPVPPTPELQAKVDRLTIVALDPGHGGEDPGAIGPSGLKEKDVVLAIALPLRDRLNALPGVRAFLTRDADFFVPLHERVRKARRVQADLFISIHADAFITPTARGASVFALSEGGATSSAARWLASKENAADLVGGANLKSRDATVLRALVDMSTTAQIKDSLRVGHEVLGELDRVGRLHKPRVEQAGFAVLKAPDIPSILVETAFISNPQEEAKLADPTYRQRLVDALATGVQRYFAKNPPLARNRQL